MVKPNNKGLQEELFQNIISLNMNCSFHKHLKITVLELSPGQAILEINIDEMHINPQNIAHGGVAFSLADTAMGMAIRSYNYYGVTIDINMNFLRPVFKGDNIHAVGRVIDLGKKIIVTEAEVLNANNEKIAVARGTFYNKGVFITSGSPNT